MVGAALWVALWALIGCAGGNMDTVDVTLDKADDSATVTTDSGRVVIDVTSASGIGGRAGPAGRADGGGVARAGGGGGGGVAVTHVRLRPRAAVSPRPPAAVAAPRTATTTANGGPSGRATRSLSWSGTNPRTS